MKQLKIWAAIEKEEVKEEQRPGAGKNDESPAWAKEWEEKRLIPYTSFTTSYEYWSLSYMKKFFWGSSIVCMLLCISYSFFLLLVTQCYAQFRRRYVTTQEKIYIIINTESTTPFFFSKSWFFWPDKVSRETRDKFFFSCDWHCKTVILWRNGI